MGYENDWELFFAASTQENLDKFVGKVKALDKDCVELLSNSTVLKNDKRDISFSGQGDKLPDEWDSFITDISEMIYGDANIIGAYTRVGEETEDIEQQDWGAFICVYREISDIVDFREYPKEVPYEDSNIKAAAPVIKEKAEELCGCGKMKDAGETCWWCGN